MKTYWDTSALVRYYAVGDIAKIKGVTRTHSLAELFSSLTGRGYNEVMKDGTTRNRRLSLRLAAMTVSKVAAQLDFVDLTKDEVLAAIQDAQFCGAQGGRIHDLLHARAAEKAKADELLTLDRNDFDGLAGIAIKQL